MSFPSPKAPSQVTWVISLTESIANRIYTELSSAFKILERPPHVVSTSLATVELDNHPANALRDDPQLCAVVFALESQGFKDRSYVDLLEWCIAQVATRDDFRLYVLLEGLTPEELDNVKPEESKEVRRRLIDTVQLTDIKEMNQISRHLIAYIKRLDETRKEAAWIRLRIAFSSMLGHIAMIVQIICIVQALILIFWLPVWDPNATLRQYVGYEGYVALICLIACTPFGVIFIYLFSRYGIFPVGLWNSNDTVVKVLGSISAIAAPHMIAVPIRISSPCLFILLGLVMGIILDAARRNSYKAIRERQAVDPDTVIERHGRLPSKLRKQVQSTYINPLRCPLSPGKIPRVFISYARGSIWGKNTAKELYEYLLKINVRVFIDKDIPEGGAWRRSLNRYLGRSTIFISLADHLSVEREWPGAELEAALEGRYLTEFPELIVIKDPELPFASEDTWKWLPVFREVLGSGTNNKEMRTKIIEFNETIIKAIAFKLHPKSYRSISVFPLGLTEYILTFWNVMGIPLKLWGAMCAYGGHLAIFIVILEIIWKIDSAGCLARYSLFIPVFLGCASWIGFTFRLALAARYHLRHHRAKGVMSAHRNAGIGLFLLLLMWGWHADLLVIGWALVIVIMSYVAADEFCTERSKKEPSFLRPME